MNINEYEPDYDCDVCREIHEEYIAHCKEQRKHIEELKKEIQKWKTLYAKCCAREDEKEVQDEYYG